MHHIGKKDLWDDKDNFYYDVVEMSDGTNERLKYAPWLVLFQCLLLKYEYRFIQRTKRISKEANEIIRTRPDLASLISNLENIIKMVIFFSRLCAVLD
jgi:hypothetical protein